MKNERKVKVRAPRPPMPISFLQETAKRAPSVEMTTENNGFFVHAPGLILHVHVGYDGDVQTTYWGKGKVAHRVDDRAQAEELRRF